MITRRDLPALVERALVGAVGVWLAIFAWWKVRHVFSDGWVEWDARGFAAVAYRFHGSGLFPRDLGVDQMSTMCPLGWKALYWLGTLALDPYQLSRLIPLGLLAFLVWQTFAFTRPRAGVVVAAAAVFLVVRCPFFWDRIVGANPRAFGLPLVVAFLRYACDGRPGATALTLVAQAAFYPSAVLFCAPAFAVLQLRAALRGRRWQPLALTGLCGAACLALALPSTVLVDPAIGRPITLEQLASLKQRAVWSFYPRPPHQWVFWRAFHLALEDAVGDPLTGRVATVASWMNYLIAAAAFSYALLRRRLPAAFLVAPIAACAAYAVAYALAYRLYAPDRIVHYAFAPLVLLPLPWLVHEALDRLPARARPWRAVLASLPLMALAVLAGGWGIQRHDALRDWSAYRTPAIEFIATLPKDVLVAAHPNTATFVQTFAHRSTLFSGVTNSANFATYAEAVERRIEWFYHAYYAPSTDKVREFCAEYGVDYLLVDRRDFGDKAVERARYVAPWTTIAATLIARAGGSFALRDPPAQAVAFHDGPLRVVACGRLR